MNCKGCGKEICGDDFRKVADWYFCQDCFQGLMQPSDSDTESGASQDASGAGGHNALPDTENSQISRQNVKKKSCEVCQAELEEGSGRKLGIWLLCDTCFNDMNASVRPDTPEPESAEADLEEETDETDSRPPVDMNKTIPCHSCGRVILAVGAKEEDGQYFCPDCYYKK